MTRSQTERFTLIDDRHITPSHHHRKGVGSERPNRPRSVSKNRGRNADRGRQNFGGRPRRVDAETHSSRRKLDVLPRRCGISGTVGVRKETVRFVREDPGQVADRTYRAAAHEAELRVARAWLSRKSSSPASWRSGRATANNVEAPNLLTCALTGRETLRRPNHGSCSQSDRHTGFSSECDHEPETMHRKGVRRTHTHAN